MDYEFRTDRFDWHWPDGVMDEDKVQALISGLVGGGWKTRFACVSMDSESAYYISERAIAKSEVIGFFHVPLENLE